MWNFTEKPPISVILRANCKKSPFLGKICACGWLGRSHKPKIDRRRQHLRSFAPVVSISENSRMWAVIYRFGSMRFLRG